GQLFRRKKPEVWRRLGEDWDAQLRDLQVELDVQCKIVFTGTSSEPLLVRE
ncbi:MAG TPA: Ger(x)C family spore germination protein, partial [Firmicutes bacterium]|nr:Ger(x)C family spore germination protein [Bacillota bacterium]